MEHIRYPGDFVTGCEIIVHTKMGPFQLIHGEWKDGIGQPAPREITAYLEDAYKRKSRPLGYDKVRSDKGDSL